MTRISRLLAGAALGLSLALSLTPAFAHEYKLGTLVIGHPHGRAMLPGAKVGGGYLVVTNSGESDDRLVKITAERAADVQLHEMSMENDVMTMRQLKDGIPVPAGATVELKPGGLHVMFMDVAQPFAEGEAVKATLTFEKAGSIDVDFKIDAPAKKAGGAHEGHGTAHSE